MIGIIENKIVRKPLMEAVRLTKEVSQAISAKDFKRAMLLRNAEFAEYQAAYMITAAADKPQLKLPPEKVCIKSSLRLTEIDFCSAYVLELFMLGHLLEG